MTTTATTANALESNLAALGPAAAPLADRLRATAPASLDWSVADDGAWTARHDATPLASLRRPLEEADRLAGSVDLVEHAAVVVLGLGLGHHVAALARRLEKTGVLVVFEPDLGLLRAVLERIDHATWIRETNLVIVTDPEDGSALARLLQGAEPLLGQGVAIVEHPPSRRRTGAAARVFTRTFAEHVTIAKTTLVTTLMRSADTMRNYLGNLPAYAAGAGVRELAGVAADRPAVIVSAGPSLRRNVDQLAVPGVRERCVIVAVQTTLKPLLERGIRPHFVTALDYHEISRRFYEGLTADDVRDVTLVVDPKAHPAILETYPGPVRCCASPVLDRILGDMRRDMGTLPAGATVAHLALYLAHHLGCGPIAMIGQDLGFPDNLYYAPGTAIHDVWSSELNPFNTIAMLEWQRIVRHRAHLHRLEDIHDRPIYTDTQMLTYLRQFERDFAEYAESGVEIIDATEGGVRKRGARIMTLDAFLAAHATQPLAPLPTPAGEHDRTRLDGAARAIAALRRDVEKIRAASRRTTDLMERMLEDQHDAVRMAEHFKEVEHARAEVAQRMEAFDILNTINQVGVFKRLRADRALELRDGLTPLERQRAQIERDLVNVAWLDDAGRELIDMLDDATARLQGRSRKAPAARRRAPRTRDDARGETTTTASSPADPRIAAFVAVAGEETEAVAEVVGDASILQHTLRRLDRIDGIDEIVVLVPAGWAVDGIVDRSCLDHPLVVETCDGGPYGPARAAVRAARAIAPGCWRGAVAGASAYDEVLAPSSMHDVMERRGIDAAIVAGADWPLVDASATSGGTALVRRYLEQPELHGLVLTQAPPGAAPCLIGRAVMNQLAEGGRLGTIGAMLTYQPHAPQPDPISRASNVQVDHVIRETRARATYDTPRQRGIVRSILETESDPSPSTVARTLQCAWDAPTSFPRELRLELTTERSAIGRYRRSLGPIVDRAPMTIEFAQRVLGQLPRDEPTSIMLCGTGDPLLHPDFETIIAIARDFGHAVIVRTELPGPDTLVDRLVAARPDVIVVDLHGDTAATCRAMLGADRFGETLDRMQRVVDRRQHLDGPAGPASLSLPWLVPCLQRCDLTYDDLEAFFDRWTHVLGAALVETPPWHDAPHASRPDGVPVDAIAPAVTPARHVARALGERMTILADGSVPVDERDVAAARCAGSAETTPIADLWPSLRTQRDEILRTDPGSIGLLLP